MSFIKLLKFGKEGEEYAKTFFKNYDEIIEAPPGKWSFWDFGIRYGDITLFYEVKRDTYTIKTGNFCIEFESNGIPSGINITQADYYIYIVEGEEAIYIIPVTDIKRMIEDDKYHQKRKLGYKYLSNCYLFKRELFERYRV